MENENIYYATGKRKTSIAKTWLKLGTGKIIVNNKSLDDYFVNENARDLLSTPLTITEKKRSL